MGNWVSNWYTRNMPISRLVLFTSATPLGSWVGAEPPEVGWPPPGDLGAEEAFSVYDHPPVWIFQKTDDYIPGQDGRYFECCGLEPGRANESSGGDSGAQTACYYPARAQAVQQANGTFSSVFNVDGLLSQQPALAAVVWWLAVIFLGWLAFPMTFVTLRGLPDRGYALSRILSLLLVSYLAWLPASMNLLPFSTQHPVAGSSASGFGELCSLLWRRRRYFHVCAAKI